MMMMMKNKPALLFLAALMLCCCIDSLQGAAPSGCQCFRVTSNPIRAQAIMKIEVLPVSGLCRRTEIIVTRRNGPRVCVNPNADWIKKVLRNLQRSLGSTVSPPASTVLQ